MKQQPPADRLPVRHAAFTLASLAAFLCAFALSAAPGLHGHLHADHAHPQHECAITILQSGVALADAPPAIPAPLLPVQFSAVAPLHPVWVANLFSYACIFAHAPPALS